MSEAFDLLAKHGPQLIQALGYAVALATVITTMTPTKKDDKILGKVVGLLERLSLLAPKEDKSSEE